MARKSVLEKVARVGLAALLALSTPSAQGAALAFLILLPAGFSHADEGVVVGPPGTTGPAPPPPIVTATTFDAYLRQDQPNTQFGTATTMHVMSRNQNRNRRAVIEFDLTPAGIPATAAVKTSYLRLFMNNAPGVSRTHAAHFITGATSWTGTTVTWNNRTTGTPWGTPGGDFNAMPAATVNTGTTDNVQLSWTILSDGTIPNIPQLWVSNPASNQGLIIKDTAEGVGFGLGTNFGQYISQNAGNGAQYPRLEIRYLRDVTLGGPTAGISEITWPWTFPAGSTAANYDGVLFARKPGTGAMFTFTPADGTAYTVGTDLGNGETVAINTSSFATVNAVEENGPDNVILPGTAYTYRAFNHDGTVITGAASAAPPHYSFGVSGNVTTAVGGGANKNWSYRTGAVTLSPPALDPGNIVLTGSNDSRLHTMSATSGARLYQPGGLIGTTGGAVQSRPVLIPAIVTSVDCDPITGGQQPCDVAYVSSADGRVYAFDSATGTQLWQSPVLGSAIVGTPIVQLATFSASYPHAFDLVVVGTRNTADTTNNAIYGLDGNTGAIVWTFAPGNLDIISSGGALDYVTNSVWFASRAGALGTQPSLWKLDTATTNPAGNLLFSVMLNSLPVANRDIDAAVEFDPHVAYLYGVTTGGDLVAVDHANPNNVFSTNVGAFSGMGFPTVLAQPGSNDDIYFSTSGGVHKRTFNRLTQIFSPGWDTSVATLGGTPSTPVFAYAPLPPFLYVGVSDGRLKKLSLSTGAFVLTRDINLGATVGDPSLDVVSLKFYVGDSSGRIYSFDIF